MKLGDLVKNIYSGELFVITWLEVDGCCEVYMLKNGKQWLIPKEHLEVIKCK